MNCPVGLPVMTLVTAFSAAGAPNLVPNGSFDEVDQAGVVSGWTTETNSMRTVSFARDTEVKRTGDASGRIIVAGEENPGWPGYSARLPVQAGQCYRITAWITTRDVERVAYVAADYLAADGKRVAFSSSGTVTGTTTDWQQVSLTAQVPTDTVTMSVRLILYGNGTAWFDDVTVVRDGAFECTMARLREPLPPDWVTRGTTSEGNPVRLHRLFQAAAKGGHYTIGIIGGSITAGAAASGMDKHYSAAVMNWFKTHFPTSEWAFVNAGIGATGTNYGCLRAQRDLLAKEPDLVVSEYAVNDGNTRECAETYEGLLRQILTTPKQPPVLMLFMMNQAGGNAQEWQEKLGRHYGLPMLSYRDLLWPEIEAKRMTWEDISPDTVHPNDIGHSYAGKLLASLLDQALASIPATPVEAPRQALPGALLTDMYQLTRLYEAADLKPMENAGWTNDPTNSWAKAWTASTPGSVMELKVSGEQLFLSYWRIRGPMGRARITIDGARPSTQEAWFEQTWGGYRHMVKLPMGGPGTHRVRLELLADKHAESTGTEFRLLCLGTAGR